jgi:hypothetical protein
METIAEKKNRYSPTTSPNFKPRLDCARLNMYSVYHISTNDTADNVSQEKHLIAVPAFKQLNA